jgi:anaerobic selenocysteine-containing dehydrogenase
LFRAFSGVARAEKPRPATGFGEALRVRGLSDTAAGLPTAALSDEILMPGSGQVKALVVVGGNPLLTWPNQAKTRRALESLELLVVVDPMMSATAQLADYVLGPRFGFETPAISFGNEGITVYGLSIGYQEPFAQYQPALIEPPAGSEVMEDWRVFYELARTMGLQLAYRGEPFDMETAPSTDALLELFVRRSRVPLGEIRQHPHGALFPDPQPMAVARDPDWPHRLELGHAGMMEELRQLDRELSEPPPVRIADRNLLLVSRREHAVYNSVGHDLPALRRRRPFNPAYLNPRDAARLGITDGASILIESSVGSLRAIAQLAEDVREGVVSIAHGFAPSDDGSGGASTAALVDDEHDYDPISGLPLMSAIPVRVRPAG